MARSLSVAVIGAGIGGLAAATALARAGHGVRVLERAEALGEVGAGIQLSPNAMRVVDWLGVGAPVRAAAMRPEAAELRLHASGAAAFRLELGVAAEARWGAPYLHVHRADLHAILLGAARGAGVEVLLGREAVPAGDEAFADGAPVAADLIVAADGVRSAFRAAVAGASSPVFSGNVAWRGTAPAEGAPEAMRARRATVWMGPRRHLVTYPLRGGRLVNFVAVEERVTWTAEGWSAPGDPEALRRAFAGWAAPVTGLLASVEETFEWGLFGHAPLPRWSRGRVTLLGDAAHPTTPFLAQGAAMALEDAAVLARALEAHDPPAALAAYEAARKPRTTRLQAASARTGRRYHSHSMAERWVKAAALTLFAHAAPERAAALNGWLYGHDALVAPI